MSTIFNKTLEDIKYKYEKVYVQIEDKIDYLCFTLFHSTFNSEAFEHHKYSNTEDKRFIEVFFNISVYMDYKGQFHKIKDKDFYQLLMD